MQMIRCMKCMAELEEGMKVCPHCGYDQDKEPQPSNGLRRNTILCGRYLVGKVIGQGGFGITYVGYDLTLEMKVAIKEYFPSGSAIRTGSYSSSVQWEFGENGETQWSEGMERFLKEARRMARLDSVPAVVRVRDVFRENQTAYIVMDFVEGDNLKHYLMSHGVLSFERCMRLLTPILDSLAVIHDSGFIHRDISPDNIMLQPDGTARLLDMGAAVDVRATQGHASMVVVKRNFSAPEQYLESESLGSWTDVYAMAATMYYCLTGKVVPEAIEREFKKTPLYFNPELKIPEAAVRAITAGLELKAENRIRDMREFKRQLMLSEVSAAGEAAVQTVAASVTTGQATATQAAAAQAAAAQTGTSGGPAVDPIHATGTPPASAVQAVAVQTSAAAQISAAQTPTMAQASKAAQAAVPRAAAGTPSDSSSKASSTPGQHEKQKPGEKEDKQKRPKFGSIAKVILVAVTIVLGIFAWNYSQMVSVVDDFGFYSRNDDGTYTLEECYMDETYIRVPAEVKGKPVTAVASRAFSRKEKIEQVRFPGTVKKIEGGIFNNCQKLRAIFLPSSIETMEDPLIFDDKLDHSLNCFTAKSWEETLLSGWAQDWNGNCSGGMAYGMDFVDDEHYSGWKTDTLSGRPMYFVDGFVRFEWQTIDGETYYFDDEAQAIRGWGEYKEGGQTYYFDEEDFFMVKGWRKIDGEAYYFDEEDGHMLRNTTTPDGFKVDEDGALTISLSSTYDYRKKNVPSEPGISLKLWAAAQIQSWKA